MMSGTLLLVSVLCGVVLLQPCSSAPLWQTRFQTSDDNNTCSPNSGSDPTFDYYLFVQQYPKGICYAKMFTDCVVPKTSQLWTIHGLWPTLKGSQNPNFCGTTGTLFDVTALESIQSSLVDFWPSSRAGQNEVFWSHEWCKHGTCAKNVSGLSTEFKYFSSVLELYKAHNYGSILTKNNIVPSNSTTVKFDSIDSAFTQALSARPFIECQYLQDIKRQVLFQISICLSKDMKPIDCDSSTYSRQTACWPNEPIYYIL